MFDLITALLAWFYSVWPSYGMSIIFLTLTAMVVATPFTLKATRSMLQMQQLAPELKKIQNEHRGDRQATNEASMAFYKEHGINPLGGCLPMLIQAPIFLVLYRVVQGLTRRTTEIGTQLGFTSLRFSGASSGAGSEYGTTPIVRNELPFDPDFLSRDTELYARLNGKTEMVSWGLDLSRSASSAMGEGIIAALPYLLMMVLVFVTGLYQQRQIQSRQTGAAINPQQQMIMRLFPYFLPVISYGIPAAVVVYFIASALYRIVQQAYITRSFYTGDDSLGARLAKQRSAAKADADDETSAKQTKSRSPKSITDGKGTPTPKRDAKTTKSGSGNRKRPASRERGTSRSGGGRTGKAPSRSRPSGGRTTTPGSRANRSAQNRSKNKKRRR